MYYHIYYQSQFLAIVNRQALVAVQEKMIAWKNGCISSDSHQAHISNQNC